MLSLYFFKLMEKIEEHEGKKYLMVDYYIVDKVLDKIGIEKFDDANILISSDNKLSDNITLKRVVILITCIKDASTFCPQLFLDHALYDE